MNNLLLRPGGPFWPFWLKREEDGRRADSAQKPAICQRQAAHSLTRSRANSFAFVLRCSCSRHTPSRSQIARCEPCDRSVRRLRSTRRCRAHSFWQQAAGSAWCCSSCYQPENTVWESRRGLPFGQLDSACLASLASAGQCKPCRTSCRGCSADSTLTWAGESSGCGEPPCRRQEVRCQTASSSVSCPHILTLPPQAQEGRTRGALAQPGGQCRTCSGSPSSTTSPRSTVRGSLRTCCLCSRATHSCAGNGDGAGMIPQGAGWAMILGYGGAALACCCCCCCCCCSRKRVLTG